MAAVPSIGRASLVEAPGSAPQAAATQGLYERHAAKIQSYCMHQLGSREEAEDAVQTTFMNAFRALGRGIVPEAESAWLFKIAENVCLSRRRSSWRRGRIESPSDFDVIEEVVAGPSRQRDELIGIEDALASMPEQQRRAILLREWQGLSYREIAAELEVSQSAVETLIFRARRSLAQGLERPDSIKPAKRKSFRRALHLIDLGTAAAALKTLLAGSAAVKATAAAVAVTAAVGTAASVGPKQDSRTPAKLPAPPTAPVVADSSSSSRSSIAFTAVAPETVQSASKASAPATSRPLAQEPARANVFRSAPARVPAAPAPVAVEQPAAAPPAAADQPRQDEPKHESSPPAAQSPRADEAKRDDVKRQDDGEKDEGKRQGGAPSEPAPAASTPKPGGNSKGKDAPAPIVEAPLPVVAGTPTAVEDGKSQDSKSDRGRGNDKRRLTSVAPAAAELTPVLEASEPVADQAVEAAAAPEAQLAVAVESSDKRSSGNGNGKRK